MSLFARAGTSSRTSNDGAKKFQRRGRELPTNPAFHIICFSLRSPTALELPKPMWVDPTGFAKSPLSLPTSTPPHFNFLSHKLWVTIESDANNCSYSLDWHEMSKKWVSCQERRRTEGGRGYRWQCKSWVAVWWRWRCCARAGSTYCWVQPESPFETNSNRFAKNSHKPFLPQRSLLGKEKIFTYWHALTENEIFTLVKNQIDQLMSEMFTLRRNCLNWLRRVSWPNVHIVKSWHWHSLRRILIRLSRRSWSLDFAHGMEIGNISHWQRAYDQRY